MTRALALLLVIAATPQLWGQTPASSDTNAVAPVLPDSDVTTAITLGQSRKNKRTYGYSGVADCTKFGAFLASNSNLRIYGVIGQGPYGRVVDASAQATRKYLPFGPGDVSAEMRAPTLTVGIQQYMEDMKTTVVPVEHVVIRGVNKEGAVGAALQPTHVEELPDYYQNLMGAKIETKGALATFDMKSLPEGDLQIVVILSDGECHATLHARDRNKIK